MFLVSTVEYKREKRFLKQKVITEVNKFIKHIDIAKVIVEDSIWLNIMCVGNFPMQKIDGEWNFEEARLSKSWTRAAFNNVFEVDEYQLEIQNFCPKNRVVFLNQIGFHRSRNWDFKLKDARLIFAADYETVDLDGCIFQINLFGSKQLQPIYNFK